MSSTSTASAPTPARSSRSARGTPVQLPVPTASSTHGWLAGRGAMNARPLPAHSIVTVRVTAGRARRSASDSETGRPTAPPTSSAHVSGSAAGMS